MLQITNSQNFEERGHVMLAAIKQVEVFKSERQYVKTKSLRAAYFEEMADIARQYTKRQADLGEVEVDDAPTQLSLLTE